MSTSRVHHECTYRLDTRQVFDGLKHNPRKAKYAHHLARACWYGSRIMLRQTSPEAEGIFDFILELHRACGGQWDMLEAHGATGEDIDAFLEFAGLFLSGLGNHFDDGDRKVIPTISAASFRAMASISPDATSKLEAILRPMLAPQPAALGYPSATSLSGYYLGDLPITKQEIKAVTDFMEVKRIAPENTRLQRVLTSGEDVEPELPVFEILQASVEKDTAPKLLGEVTIENGQRAKVYLRRGDHAQEMAHICAELTQAIEHASPGEQEAALSYLVESFRTGNYEAFGEAHKIWVKDKAPSVEHCMGFLFGYRDPFGARAECKMKDLVAKSTELVRTLPWAVAGENDGKGPFEPTEPDVPDFAIIHVLASVSSTVWEATNMTIEDNGKTIGIKNMVYGNRTSLNSRSGRPCYYVHSSEAIKYMESAHIVRTIGTAIHELVGHGTGKLLYETSPGKFNFVHPPISPVTKETIRTWYKAGQTYTSVFGDLASTVEECRAFLVASYLADNKDVLALYGYNEQSTPSADDRKLVYYAYLRIGVEGLRAPRSFNAESRTWAGDHDRAQFAILKHLLLDGDGVISIIKHDEDHDLYVQVNPFKILSHGKPSLGRMLCRIHTWHCTADIETCRPYYESLSDVDQDGDYEEWRRIVVSKTEPKWKFVQPNTFLLDDGTVELREYEATNVGIIVSFVERGL
ncbi:dipeptidyl-peptidase 3 [Rhypophila sp. PSN 637]